MLSSHSGSSAYSPLLFSFRLPHVPGCGACTTISHVASWATSSHECTGQCLLKMGKEIFLFFPWACITLSVGWTRFFLTFWTGPPPNLSLSPLATLTGLFGPAPSHCCHGPIPRLVLERGRKGFPLLSKYLTSPVHAQHKKFLLPPSFPRVGEHALSCQAMPALPCHRP